MVEVTQQLAVVTGANRGLGLETCRQLAQRGLQVILTSRAVAQKGKRWWISFEAKGWQYATSR